MTNFKEKKEKEQQEKEAKTPEEFTKTENVEELPF